MSASNYWILLRLNTAGQASPKVMPTAERFFRQQFEGFGELEHRKVQARLVLLSQSVDQTTAQLALLCLRCFVSHQIVKTCARLVQQFGDRYSFRLTDVLPFVLDDQGRIEAEFSKTLSSKVLKSFRAEKGSLAAWTTRFVQQRSDLTQFLVQQGFILASDWAILNDTTPRQLRRILTEVYLLSHLEIDRAIALLSAYHLVYRDALLSHTHRGRCVSPSIAQLCQMRSRTDATSPSAVMSRLKQLAQYLRQYRVQCRRGSVLTCSIEQLILQPDVAIDETNVCPVESQFLRRYQQALAAELDAAIVHVLNARMQRFNPASVQRFLLALHGLYCEQLTMTEIAAQLGLPGQYSIAHLLRLPNLRSQIQTQLIQRLNPRLSPLLPVQTINLDQVLQEQVESLFTSDAQYLRTSVIHRRPESRSLFTLRMADYLDRWIKSSFTAKTILPAAAARVEPRS